MNEKTLTTAAMLAAMAGAETDFSIGRVKRRKKVSQRDAKYMTSDNLKKKKDKKKMQKASKKRNRK